jgi:hypothetical protein
VGIGTTTPSRILDIVTNNSNTQDMIVHIGENSNEGGYLGSFTPSDLKIAGGTDFVSGSWIARDVSSSHIRLLNGNTYFSNNTGLTVNNPFTPDLRMIITPYGNVGIGTPTPQGTLHVKGNGTILTLEGVDHGYIQWYPLGFSNNRKAYIGFPNPGSTDLTVVNEFTTGTNNILLIPGTNGKVGIGTATPLEKLHVNGNAYIQGSLAIGNTASVTGLDVRNVSRIGNNQFLTDAIELSYFGSADRYTYIDFHGDNTYNDYGLRIDRGPGVNANSAFYHRGTGSLILHTNEAAPITFYTANAQRMTITGGGNVGIGTTNPTSKVVVQPSSTWDNNTPLFEVKNSTGQTVFAVYNEGVRVYVADGAKGLKGGFAVGGFGTDKAESQKYLVVSKDSTRIYLDTNPLTKKLKGGFAVGGYDLTKDITTNFMNVSIDESEVINPPQNRVVWYPVKNAFLTGRVLITSPTNVGINSFASGYESRAKGAESQAMGFKAIADGDYSTAIGKNAIANNINSFAFGDSPQATGNDSYAIGAGAKAQGIGSYAFGSAGRDASGNLTGGMTTSSGNYSFSIGQGSISSGMLSMAIGTNVTASGLWSTAMGLGAIASGVCAFSYGTIALCTDFTAFPTVAAGDYSIAIGQGVTAKSYGMVALGRFNQDFNGSLTSPIQTDQLFVIGNGTGCPNRKNAMTILKNGMIGLQTVTSPTYALQLPNSTTPGVGQAQANAWVTYSDARIKSNQHEINYGLKEILELQPKQYIQHNSDNYIENLEEDLGIITLGLIAQEVYDIIPEVVSKPIDENQLWGVDYNKIIPVLIKGIQEQQQQIESYKSENDNLKSQLQSLQEEVEQIKAMLAKGGGN